MANIRLNIEVRTDGAGKLQSVAKDLEQVDLKSKKAQGSVSGLAGSFKGMAVSFAAMSGAASTLAGIGVSLFKLAQQAGDYAEKIQNAAANTGISTRSLQAFDAAAKAAGGSLDEITAGVTRMQKQLEVTPKVFKALGLDAAELKRLDPGEAFLKVANAISGISNAVEKTNARIAVFGRAGATMQPLLDAAIKAEEQFTKLGLGLEDDVIKNLAELDDQLDTLDAAFSNFLKQIGATIAASPEFRQAILGMVQSLAAMGKFIADNRSRFVDFFNVLTFAGSLGTLGGPGIVNRLLGRAQFGNVVSGSSTAGPGGGVGRFRLPSSSDEAGARKAESDAARAAKAWDKAAEDAREAWDKFYDEMSIRSLETVRALQDSAGRGISIATVAGRQQTKFLDAFFGSREQYRANVGAINDAINDLVARHNQAKLEIIDAWDEIAGSLASQGGLLGAIGQAGAAVVAFVRNVELANQRVMAGVKRSTVDMLQGIAMAVQAAGAILQGPGGLKGILGGALSGAAVGSAFGPVGAIVGAGVGGILGLFGSGGKKQAEERKRQQEAARLEAIERQKQLADQFVASTSALTGIFTKLSPATEAGARAQATIFSTTFWAVVKERGFGVAIQALSEPFEALNKSLTEKFGPELTAALLGGLAIFFDPKIKETVSLFSDIQQALEGVSKAGFLTSDSFKAYQTVAQDAFGQAIAGGLGQQDALKAIAPLLGAIIDASRRYGFVIDEATQALIDQAKAAGVAFPVDPITRAADAMERLVRILERIHGLSEEVGGSFDDWNIPGDDSRPGPGGPRQPAARGFGPKIVPDLGGGLGPLIQTHAGEGVLIVPRALVRRGGLFHAAAGFGRGFSRDESGDVAEGGGTGGGGGGGGGSMPASDSPMTSADEPFFEFGGGGSAAVTAIVTQQKLVQSAIANLAKSVAAIADKPSAQVGISQQINIPTPDLAAVPANREQLFRDMQEAAARDIARNAGQLASAIGALIERKVGSRRFA